jgi:hypothetical protein
MPRRRHTRSEDWLFPKAAIESDAQPESSLLDVIDSVLNKGAVVNGDLVLGLANVDLIYAKLSVLLSAFDRVMGQDVPRRKRGPTLRTSKRVPTKRRQPHRY